MSEDEVFEKIKDILKDQLSIENKEIELSSKLIDDLGADSLDLVELVMAMEEEFGVEIPDSDAESILTVEDVVKYICDKI